MTLQSRSIVTSICLQSEILRLVKCGLAPDRHVRVHSRNICFGYMLLHFTHSIMTNSEIKRGATIMVRMIRFLIHFRNYILMTGKGMPKVKLLCVVWWDTVNSSKCTYANVYMCVGSEIVQKLYIIYKCQSDHKAAPMFHNTVPVALWKFVRSNRWLLR